MYGSVLIPLTPCVPSLEFPIQGLLMDAILPFYAASLRESLCEVSKTLG
jgi:hypothetical protein